MQIESNQTGKALATSRGGLPAWRRPDALKPSERGDAIAVLSACLALVRPAGMTGGEAADWLGVAAQTVEHLPFDILQSACLSARKTCTHYSQIVPAIIATGDAALAERRELRAPPVIRYTLPPAEDRRFRGPPIRQAEIDRMNPEMIELGLKCGALARDADGNVCPAD